MMNEVDTLLDAAFQDYNTGDYRAAEQKTRQALLLSPTHGDALYLLGLIAYKKGIWTEAIDILSLIVKTYPDYPNYRLALAEMYQNHGDLNKAKELYLSEPDNSYAKAEIGWIEMQQGNIKEAKKIFKKYPVARSLCGLAELSKGREKLALLKRAYTLEASVFVIKELAFYYLDKKKYKEAKKYIIKLPKDKYLQAFWMKIQKQEKKAISLLKELTTEQAFFWQAWLLLGEIAESIKDIPLAESSYRQTLHLKPDLYVANQKLARLLMKNGRLSEALDIYQKLVRRNPKDKEILLAVANILEGVNEIEEALGIYFNLLTLGQKSLSGTIKRLILRLAKTNKESACRFAKGWQKNFPKDPTAKRLLNILKVLLVVFSLWTSGVNAEFLMNQNMDLLWHAKMAEYGDPVSQYELAKMYEEGQQMPKNLPKAIHYYQLSAYQNYIPSAMALGRIFLKEKVVFDEKKSLEWYTYAANRGDGQAQNYLFHYYDEMEQPQLKEAFYWLEKMLKGAFPEEQDFSKVSADYERLKKEINQ